MSNRRVIRHNSETKVSVIDKGDDNASNSKYQETDNQINHKSKITICYVGNFLIFSIGPYLILAIWFLDLEYVRKLRQRQVMLPMLFLLMGVGLIFSNVVKNDTMIPLLVNLFGFPQMMLSGTFFPIEVFPKWLQHICNILPLTQFNNAVRKISFEGLSLLDCGKEIGILAIWMAITYLICIKVMKWE